jgi:hypothetical protein
MALPQWYVNAKDITSDIWTHAGTKVIGWATAAVGALALLDSTTIQVIGNWLGPVWGPRFAFGCLIAAGLLTKQRGNRNTSDIADHIISRANAGDEAASAAVASATSNAVAASDKVLLIKSLDPSTPPKGDSKS